LEQIRSYPTFWELELLAWCHARYCCASVTAVGRRHKDIIFLKRLSKNDIYRSNKYTLDYVYGIAHPKMFDNALKTKEKLNLDYFELFFSQKQTWL
jgi:hypothetical protein